MTGTFDASSAFTILFIEVLRPPGVSSRMTIAS